MLSLDSTLLVPTPHSLKPPQMRTAGYKTTEEQAAGLSQPIADGITEAAGGSHCGTDSTHGILLTHS